MPCLCTANTLRSFVRSVAQVDLPNATRFAAARQLPRRPIPACRYPHASRAYSSTREYQDEFEDFVEAAPAPGKARGWPQKDDELDGQTSKSESYGAIVDFSPEAIDAIAAEAASKASQDGNYTAPFTSGYDTPLKSLLRDMPPRKEYTPMEQIRGTVIRKGRSENKGFKLHYSADPNWEKIEEQSKRIKSKRARQEEEAAEEAERAAEAAKVAKDAWVPPPREPWMIAKEKIKAKYPDGYNPLKRLSPDAITGIRALHAQLPEQYTCETLAEEFKVSPEAIQRILRSKWRPSPEEQTDREERWHKRGERVWTRLADMGTKPPKEWRDLGIGAGKPDWMKKRDNPRPRAPLPALITTARRKEAKFKASKDDSLADRII